VLWYGGMGNPVPKFIAKRSRLSPSGFVIIEHQEKLFDAYMANIVDDTFLSVVVRKESTKRIRSLRANAYYWGVVIKELCEFFGYSPEQMHDALGVKFRIKWDILDLPTVQGTSSMKSDEFFEYIELVRRWAASEWGINIPDPVNVDIGN